jgi:hypothetical protein
MIIYSEVLFFCFYLSNFHTRCVPPVAADPVFFDDESCCLRPYTPSPLESTKAVGILIFLKHNSFFSNFFFLFCRNQAFFSFVHTSHLLFSLFSSLKSLNSVFPGSWRPLDRLLVVHDHMALRRPHRKSRHGCLECKRRRVKVWTRVMILK